MFLGCLLLLFLTTGLGMIAEGSFDFIYVVIIGMLAIAYPILCYIMLFLYNPQDQLMDIIFPIMVTIAELIGIIFLSSKFIITHDAKRVRKIIGYIINITSMCCILAIIIRSLMVIF
jgi:hypothetical protein